MAQFIVHTVPGSPFGRAVLATLEEKRADYRLAPVAPGTLRAAAHLARHPFGKIPVLQHNDFTLYETQAILRYLDRILPDPTLTPSTAQAAARMDQIMNISDCYLFQGVANVIGFERVVSPLLFGGTPNEAAIEAAMPKAHVVFNELGNLLADQPFFTGKEISLADLHVAPQMDFLSQTPEWITLTAANSNLATWLQRISARPSLQATTWQRVAATVA